MLLRTTRTLSQEACRAAPAFCDTAWRHGSSGGVSEERLTGGLVKDAEGTIRCSPS